MSAINYPVAGPSSGGLRRLVAALQPRRWDDPPHIERTTSPSEIALRAASGIPRMHR